MWRQASMSGVACGKCTTRRRADRTTWAPSLSSQSRSHATCGCVRRRCGQRAAAVLHGRVGDGRQEDAQLVRPELAAARAVDLQTVVWCTSSARTSGQRPRCRRGTGQTPYPANSRSTRRRRRGRQCQRADCRANRALAGTRPMKPDGGHAGGSRAGKSGANDNGSGTQIVNDDLRVGRPTGATVSPPPCSVTLRYPPSAGSRWTSRLASARERIHYSGIPHCAYRAR